MLKKISELYSSQLDYYSADFSCDIIEIKKNQPGLEAPSKITFFHACDSV